MSVTRSELQLMLQAAKELPVGELGQLGPSLGYTIDHTGKFCWTGESELTASVTLAPEMNLEQAGAIEQARTFLLDALARGPCPAKEIEAEASARDISHNTLKRAKKSLGVRSEKAQ